MKRTYLVLCIVGTALPYFPFVLWLSANGPDAKLFAEQMFANRISAFFAMDVLVSALALMAFAGAESKRLNMGLRERLLILLAVLTVGVSLALPLFLYLREDKLATAPPKGA